MANRPAVMRAGCCGCRPVLERRLEPQACCFPPPPCVWGWGGVGCLTFHSARTSRASRRRPPSVLPTMIQMGICEFSCLEISNVICKGREVARSTALLFQGLGGNLGQGQSTGDRWHLVGELHSSSGRC